MGRWSILGKLNHLQEGELATLKEHQKALYCILQEFDRVCKTLGITYFLFAGTLLGSVRHKGFIPWDDDLDVIMHRKDYARFLNEAPALLDKENFFLQAEFSKHYPMYFSKLHLNDTTCLERFHPKDAQMHQGVYMDIFPLDNVFHSSLGKYVQFACSKVIIAKGLDARGYTTGSKLKKLVMMLSRFFPAKLLRGIVHGPAKTGKYVHCFLGGASKMSSSVFPAAFFDSAVSLPFEGGFYTAPEQYDAVLKVLYGDYMKIPGEDEQGCKKHAVLVDLKHPYEYHKKYHDEMEFESSVKSIR